MPYHTNLLSLAKCVYEFLPLCCMHCWLHPLAYGGGIVMHTHTKEYKYAHAHTPHAHAYTHITVHKHMIKVLHSISKNERDFFFAH